MALVTLFVISILIFVAALSAAWRCGLAILGRRDAGPRSPALREQLPPQPTAGAAVQSTGLAAYLHGDLGKSAADRHPHHDADRWTWRRLRDLPPGSPPCLLVPPGSVTWRKEPPVRAGRKPRITPISTQVPSPPTALPEFVTGTLLIFLLALHFDVVSGRVVPSHPGQTPS